jgi:hypothetical protein
LAEVALNHMTGWDTGAAPDIAALERSRERALAAGAGA